MTSAYWMSGIALNLQGGVKDDCGLYFFHISQQRVRERSEGDNLLKLKCDCCKTEFPSPCLGGICFQRKVSGSQRKMMRRLFIYWHFPRHMICRGLWEVILKGFYPGWLRFHCPALCNFFFTIVCARGDGNLLERSWHSATHFFSVSAQAPFPDVCNEWALTQAREKHNKTAEWKPEVVALCWRPQRSLISSKALLQKNMYCLTSV